MTEQRNGAAPDDLAQTLPVGRSSAPPRPAGGSNVPQQIGRYQVLERVGHGGMGVLYRGVDPVLDREVAIKVMLEGFEDTEQMRPRFFREARSVAKLQHRNIVTVFEFAEETGKPYIVMEFLRGTSLATRIETAPPLTLDDKLDIIGQLCAGLGYAHEQGVVHRDVKPANVFLLTDTTVKLLDFGIAKVTTSNLTRQGDVLGSVSYMSPEQVMGSDAVDGRADIFSTGVVLYELLAGRKPFEGQASTAIVMKIMKEDPVPIEAVAPGTSPRLAAIVAKALQKDPACRYATAAEFGRELQIERRALQSAGGNTILAPGAALTAPDAIAAIAEKAAAAASPAANRRAVRPATIGAGIAATALIATGLMMWSQGWFGGATATADPAAGGTKAPVSTPAGKPVEPAPRVAEPASVPASSPPSAAATVNRPRREDGAPPPRREAVKPPVAAAASIAVTATGQYPFEVHDGARVLSPAGTTHQLNVAAGRKLRLVASKYFLNKEVTIEPTPEKRQEIEVPRLGSLSVRSANETCTVKIGDRALGNPPLNNVQIAPGTYQIDLVCANGTQKESATIAPGQSYTARIK